MPILTLPCRVQGGAGEDFSDELAAKGPRRQFGIPHAMICSTEGKCSRKPRFQVEGRASWDDAALPDFHPTMGPGAHIAAFPHAATARNTCLPSSSNPPNRGAPSNDVYTTVKRLGSRRPSPRECSVSRCLSRKLWGKNGLPWGCRFGRWRLDRRVGGEICTSDLEVPS